MGDCNIGLVVVVVVSGCFPDVHMLGLYAMPGTFLLFSEGRCFVVDVYWP